MTEREKMKPCPLEKVFDTRYQYGEITLCQCCPNRLTTPKEEATLEGAFIMQIRFDGPPGPEAGRFVEVEDMNGASFNAGEWVQDGEYWLLKIRSNPTREGDALVEAFNDLLEVSKAMLNHIELSMAVSYRNAIQKIRDNAKPPREPDDFAEDGGGEA